jgi:hypothetical protein
MFDVMYPGRTLLFDSPLSVEEVTRRLEREVAPPAMELFKTRQQLFEGTFADRQFTVIRRVRGRNSFRPWIKGRVLEGSRGARVEVRLQMSPLVLVFGLVFAIVAGTIAAVAAPELPLVGGSPLGLRLLVAAAVALLFAALGNFEARAATRLLETVIGAKPTAPLRNSAEAVAQHR